MEQNRMQEFEQKVLYKAKKNTSAWTSKYYFPFSTLSVTLRHFEGLDLKNTVIYLPTFSYVSWGPTTNTDYGHPMKA